jgi:glutathionylspermidine synthase
MLLHGCKWDPQVEDVSTLADFPLLIEKQEWSRLSQAAEQLAAELSEMEHRLIHRPDLYSRLGLPRRIRRVLSRLTDTEASPSAVRTLRFDFHWTCEGWRISEVNSDVPGGYSEASEFPRLMCQYIDGCHVPGDPAGVWAEAVCDAAKDRPVALLSAPGFMEDQQVVAYLARRLVERGAMAYLVSPSQITWEDGAAMLIMQQGKRPLGVVVRFYQAEWFAGSPQNSWEMLFSGGKTPVTNPAVAALTESKRLPLIWDELGAGASTWRRLLPETCDPRGIPWRSDPGWLVKTAYCNTGDSVTVRGLCTRRQWWAAQWGALLFPGQWIAQRRFVPLSVSSPMGELYPCVGVFTINGRAAGAYTRLSRRPIVDYRAIDVPLLIREDQ